MTSPLLHDTGGASRSIFYFSTRPLPPMGFYNLTCLHVTSYTPAFGRMATSERVRSPMRVDLGSEARVHTGSSLPLSRHPWRCFGGLARPRLVSWCKTIVVVSPVDRMKDTREAPTGPLRATSVGSMLTTYETLGSLALAGNISLRST
jgi:hypothetical protein